MKRKYVMFFFAGFIYFNRVKHDRVTTNIQMTRYI